MSKRKKVVVQANKLDNVEVDFISLVPRGANQLPFRILKSDTPPENKPMIDLATLFKIDEPIATEPAFGGVIVKTADAEEWKTTLGKAGYGPLEAQTTSTEGLTFLARGDASLDGAAVLKANDELAVVVTGLEKGIVNQLYDDVPFKDSVQSVSFMPSFHLATDVLVEKMYEVVTEPGDRDATLKKMDTLLKDYAKYINSVAKALPVDIFKIDSLEKEESESAEDTKKADKETKSKLTDPTSGGNKVTKDDKEGTQKGDENKDDPLAKVMMAIGQLGDRMTKLEEGLAKAETDRAEVAAVKGELSKVQESLDGVVKSTGELHEAVTGQALAGPGDEGDGATGDTLTKDADDVFDKALGDVGKGIEII